MKMLRKMDEMERGIVSKAEKIALLFAKAALIVWCIYLFVTAGLQKMVASGPFLLLSTTVVVQLWVMQFMRWRISKGSNDEK